MKAGMAANYTLDNSLFSSSLDKLASEPAVIVRQRNMCVIWKPPGWTVSVGADDCRDNSKHVGQPLESWVDSALGKMCPIAKDSRAGHGLLHRLDRNTSGAVLCAIDYRSFYQARLQMAVGHVRKEYVCLCCGFLPPEPRLLEDRLNLVKTSTGAWCNVVSSTGERACTEIRGVKHMVDAEGTRLSLVEIRLHTGRMHQIRSHLSHAGYPLVGDTAYKGGMVPWCPRIFLHASTLALDLDDVSLAAQVPLPADLRQALSCLSSCRH